MNIVIILPTYNEKENIALLIRALQEQFSTIPHTMSILVVDDNSPDGTAEVVRTECRASNVHLITGEKQGLGAAYIRGMKYAISELHADAVMEMDADFSHDPKEIPNFLKAIEGADIVLGSRYKDGIRVVNWPLKRLVLSKGASIYVRIITGLPVMDPTVGFKCFRRRVLESMELDNVRSNGYAFQVEMTYTAWMQGFRVTEIPITFADRYAGKSKMSGKIVREALWMVWALASANGFRRSPRKRS